MKRITSIIIVLTLLLAVPAIAQENKRPRFNPEEFNMRMKAFIAQKACLTPEESEKVFPIYLKMKEKQRELKHKEIKLKKQNPSSEKECLNTLDQITDLHEQFADIEEDYYKKMCKVIPARKVYNIILAEDAFHREMLQHANPHHGDKDKQPQPPQHRPR